jgi:hypothetical protein
VIIRKSSRQNGEELHRIGLRTVGVVTEVGREEIMEKCRKLK